MRLNSRGRGRGYGNFQTKNRPTGGMMGQKPMIRSNTPGVFYPPNGNFGGFTSKFNKKPQFNNHKNYKQKYNGPSVTVIDLNKPWVTDEIRNEETKKQELLLTWKNTKSSDDWNKFLAQKLSVQLLYEKAQGDYTGNHSNEAVFGNSISSQYYCETCDKSFRSNQGLILHKAEHETCGRDGCEFTAHPKIIAKHIKMQHASGLYKRIGKFYTEEDIAKWIEERKKRYPTRKVVEEKKKLEQEKLNRGERIKDDDSKFNKSFQKLHKRGRKKFEKKNSQTGKNLSKKKQKKTPVVQKCIEEESRPIRKGIPAFSGIKGDKIPEVPKDHLDITDEEWEPDQIATKPLVNSLGLLASLYVSDEEKPDKNLNKETKEEYISSDEDSGPEEVKTVTSKNPLPKEDSKVSFKKSEINKKENSRKRRRKKSFDTSSVEKKERRITLLEKLLKNEIRHERNVILQCVHYIVKNNFFKT